MSINWGCESTILPSLCSRVLLTLVCSIEQEYVNGLQTTTVEEMIERARAFLLEMSALLPQGSTWLFGLEEPTALDAHLVPFLLRLKDVKRENLISGNLREYVERAEGTREWREVMMGRSTYSPATNVPVKERYGVWMVGWRSVVGVIEHRSILL